MGPGVPDCLVPVTLHTSVALDENVTSLSLSVSQPHVKNGIITPSSRTETGGRANPSKVVKLDKTIRRLRFALKILMGKKNVCVWEGVRHGCNEVGKTLRIAKSG